MMNEPQFFAAPDGTEMVIITRARFDALLAAEEDMEDLAAAHEGAASIAAEGAIPLEVSNAIANGAHPITAWRKHRGLTQAQLADQTGFTQAAVARLEKTDPGRGRPETVDAIARALDAPRWALAAHRPAPAGESSGGFDFGSADFAAVFSVDDNILTGEASAFEAISDVVASNYDVMRSALSSAANKAGRRKEAVLVRSGETGAVIKVDPRLLKRLISEAR